MNTGTSNRFILNILGERRWRWVLRGLSRSDAGTKLRGLYQPSLLTRLLFPLAYWHYRAPWHNESCSRVEFIDGRPLPDDDGA